MPIKRSSAPLKRPAAPRRTASSRSKASEESPSTSTPRAMSQEEKRQMILAHAAMRDPRRHDPIQVMSLWAGVVAVVAVILGGWWWAATPTYVKALREPTSSDLSEAVEDIKSFGDRLQEVRKQTDDSALGKELTETKGQLDAVKNEAESRKEALDRVADLLNTTGTEALDPNLRADLFKPEPSGVSSSTTKQPATP